jgi:hypothetical protein
VFVVNVIVVVKCKRCNKCYEMAEKTSQLSEAETNINYGPKAKILLAKGVSRAYSLKAYRTQGC